MQDVISTENPSPNLVSVSSSFPSMVYADSFGTMHQAPAMEATPHINATSSTSASTLGASELWVR